MDIVRIGCKIGNIFGKSEAKMKLNEEEALQRLQELIKSALAVPKPRKKSKPTWSSQQKRPDSKNKRSQIKTLRSKVRDD